MHISAQQNSLNMKLFLNLILLCFCSDYIIAQQNFNVKLIRKSISNNLVKGKLYVNGEYLGITYENDALKISQGKYPGYLRYVSIGKKGDFLLEIGSVKWSDGKKRTDLLFHGGNKPHHSNGCIMLGGISRDEEGNRYLPENHTLAKLRKAFYGTDTPISSPNKKVTIEIVDVFLFGGTWSIKDDDDTIQLVIAKSGSSIKVKYNWIWFDGEVERYTPSNVKLVNSKKIIFNLKEDGDNYKCELRMSADQKSINWKLIDTSDGARSSYRLRKN